MKVRLERTECEAEWNAAMSDCGPAAGLKQSAVFQKAHVDGVFVGADLRYDSVARIKLDAGE